MSTFEFAVEVKEDKIEELSKILVLGENETVVGVIVQVKAHMTIARRGSYTQPAEPAELEIDDFNVVGLEIYNSEKNDVDQVPFENHNNFDFYDYLIEFDHVIEDALISESEMYAEYIAEMEYDEMKSRYYGE